MQKIFNNILVPVVLNGQASQVLEKVAAFSNKLECHLHVIFIFRQPLLSGWISRRNENNVKATIHRLHQQYSFLLKRGLKLFTTLQRTGTESTLEKYLEVHEIDLIMVNADLKSYVFRNMRSVTNSSSHLMHCPVLTVKSFPDLNECHTIVLPINNQLPVQKLRVAIFLAKHFEAQIHLVAADHDHAGESIACMERAYRVLRDNTGIEVFCNRIPGKDLSTIASRYAGSVNGGLMLMDPGAMSPVQRILSRLVPTWSQPVMNVPVITMS